MIQHYYIARVPSSFEHQDIVPTYLLLWPIAKWKCINTTKKKTRIQRTHCDVNFDTFAIGAAASDFALVGAFLLNIATIGRCGWLLGLVTFGFQMTLVVIILTGYFKLSKDSTPFDDPIDDVDKFVLVGQL